MGNKSSRPPAPPAVVKPAGGVSAVAAPMDAVTACRVKNVELSQLQNDVTRKQTEIDTCNPAEADRRRTEAKLQEFRSYVAEKEKILGELDSSIKSTLSTINSVHTSTKPARSYIDKLTNESNTLSKSQLDFEQAERTQRRNFLDNGPQDGVSGLLGVRTDDDKILLAFWIVYGIAIVAATVALLNVYGGELSAAQKIQIGLVVFFVCYGLAYYGITVYG
jgi:hypothetical protein